MVRGLYPFGGKDFHTYPDQTTVAGIYIHYSSITNRVLRRVFGPKRDEVTGEWRKLHNKALSDLYSLPNIV